MKKDVMITISGLHPEHDENEAVELIVPGTYMKNGDKLYLSYDDTDEDGTVTKCRLKITGEEVRLTKEGTVTTELLFRNGEKYESCYSTPFGDMIMETETKNIRVSEEDGDLLDVDIKYAIYLNGEFSSNCELAIKVEERF